MPRPRNTVARSPLLRKGGAHQKSKSAERGAAKRELKKTTREQAKERDRE
ncbi:MAG: hypothetical protein U1F68_06940 [Gammaproteobacteria bacterium]